MQSVEVGGSLPGSQPAGRAELTSLRNYRVPLKPELGFGSPEMGVGVSYQVLSSTLRSLNLLLTLNSATQ